MIKLTSEQLAAAMHPDGLHCNVEGHSNSFVIVDADTYLNLKRALYDKNVVESVKKGFEDCRSGRSLSIEQADAKMRNRIGFDQPKEK